MKKILFFCHRGSASLERMVPLARQRGLAPVAITSACADGGLAWSAMCERLEVPNAISTGVNVQMGDVDALLRREGGDYVGAYANWDGQRVLMATVNERCGARDLRPDAVRLAQDKLAFRRALIEHGLSRLSVWPADSRQARDALANGQALIVKPRRGAGSLFTGKVRQTSELERLLRLFDAGIEDDDIFSEFTHDNELIAETFFAGTEFSFELIRKDGATAFWCAHEKTRMEFTDLTILERGFSSPCVSISEQDCSTAFALIEKALTVLELTDGCFHVEMLRDAAGQWEFIEVNTRIGGALISDSVQAQYGRDLLADWLALLHDGDLGVAAPAPTVGTYLQFSYTIGDQRIASINQAPHMRAPDLIKVLAKVGDLARGDREQFAALCLWKTDRRQQQQEVAALAADEYITIAYED